MQQAHLPGVTPIMIGHGGARPELQLNSGNAIMLPTAAELQAQQGIAPLPVPAVAPLLVAPVTQLMELPAVAEQGWAVAEQAVAAPVAIQSSMNVVVSLVTKAVIELPWGFIKDTLNYAFLSPLGEICIADVPPTRVSTNNIEHWTLMDGAECLVLGKYGDVTHWRDSLTMRPDTAEELAEEDKHVTVADVHEAHAYVEEVVVAPVVEELVAQAVTIQKGISQAVYAAMSRGQKNKHKKTMARKGLDYLGNEL